MTKATTLPWLWKVAEQIYRVLAVRFQRHTPISKPFLLTYFSTIQAASSQGAALGRNTARSALKTSTRQLSNDRKDSVIRSYQIDLLA
jgi:hypothetical protein